MFLFAKSEDLRLRTQTSLPVWTFLLQLCDSCGVWDDLICIPASDGVLWDREYAFNMPSAGKL